MVSDGSLGRVGGIEGCCAPGPWGWCPDARDGRQCDPETLRRRGRGGGDHRLPAPPGSCLQGHGRRNSPARRQRSTVRPLPPQAQFVQQEAAPQLLRMEHSAQFMDLVAACAQFVTTAGRIVPNLRGEHYDDSERDTLGRGLARVRAAADWIENAILRADPDSRVITHHLSAPRTDDLTHRTIMRAPYAGTSGPHASTACARVGRRTSYRRYQPRVRPVIQRVSRGGRTTQWR